MDCSTSSKHSEEVSSLNDDETLVEQVSTHIVSDAAKSVRSPSTKATTRSFKKRNRDARSSMPRRPLSAYNFFFKAERIKILGDIRKEQEGRTIQDVRPAPRKSANFELLAKTVAERWKNLPAEAAEKYHLLSKKDRERYKKEMDDYHALRLSQKPFHLSTTEGPSNSNVTWTDSKGSSNVAALGKRMFYADAPSSDDTAGDNSMIRDALRVSSVASDKDSPSSISSKRTRLVEEDATTGGCCSYSSTIKGETAFLTTRRSMEPRPQPSVCLDSTQTLLLRLYQHRTMSLMPSSHEQASNTLDPDLLLRSCLTPDINSFTARAMRLLLPADSNFTCRPTTQEAAVLSHGLMLQHDTHLSESSRQRIVQLLSDDQRKNAVITGPILHAELRGGHSNEPLISSWLRSEKAKSQSSEYFRGLSNIEVAARHHHQQGHEGWGSDTPSLQQLSLITDDSRMHFIRHCGSLLEEPLPSRYGQGTFAASSLPMPASQQCFNGFSITDEILGSARSSNHRLPSMNAAICTDNRTTQSLLHDIYLRTFFGQAR